MPDSFLQGFLGVCHNSGCAEALICFISPQFILRQPETGRLSRGGFVVTGYQKRAAGVLHPSGSQNVVQALEIKQSFTQICRLSEVGIDERVDLAPGDHLIAGNAGTC